MWDVALGAIGSIAGGLLGDSGAKKQAKKNRQAAQRMFDEQMTFAREQAEKSFQTWERDHYYRIQDTAADARAAGLHPLFALGAGGGSGGGAFIPGQAPSGSFADAGASGLGLAEGVSRAADVIGKGFADKQDRETQEAARRLEQAMAWDMHKAQLAEMQSRTHLNLVEAQRLDSEQKTAAQRILGGSPAITGPGAAAPFLTPASSGEIVPAQGFAPKGTKELFGWLPRNNPFTGQAKEDLRGGVAGELLNALDLMGDLGSKAKLNFEAYQNLYRGLLRKLQEAFK